jgi:hypothetical protein
MAFKDVRRQKFLGEARAKEFDEDLRHSIESAREKLDLPELSERARRSFAWSVASESLERLILSYTAGRRVSDMSDALPSVISAFNRFVPCDIPRPNEAHTLTITQHEAYVYVFWLLSLCQLLGHAELIQTVMDWIDSDADFNRGRDGLFEATVEKLTGNKVATERVLLHPATYKPLARATVAENPEERPALVKEFLEGWYKNMKPCYWHGTHLDKEGSHYFGYWAFEAALVTYLWDIDDSSYRDHLVYPKDLVDFAREHFPYRGPVAPATGTSRLRCEGGQPCPREGWWFTPAQADSRRYFHQGEVMPTFSSTTWATIWQWDESQ